MYFRRLALLHLILSGGDHRGSHLLDSRYEAQRQSSAPTRGFAVSVEAREVFVPGVVVGGVKPALAARGAAGPLRAARRAGERRPFRPRRAGVDLHAARGQEAGAAPLTGDTGGAVLFLDKVTLSRGSVDLLEGAELRVMPGERLGLVGPNGAGKSTLLRAIIGDVTPVDGRVSVARNVVVGYLEQTAVGGSRRTVYEEVTAGMAGLRRAEQAVAEATDRADLDALARAFDALETEGAATAEARVGRVLKGLGFGPADQHRSCADFSGGWQMRIALARLLLSAPDLLLLDEPSNHLDRPARDWLGRYLAGYSGTVVLVSHDEELLNNVCTRIAEISGGRLRSFMGNLAAFRAKASAADAQRESELDKIRRERERMQVFVDRFGAKATKASQAESRKKAIAKLDGEAAKLTDASAVAAKRKRPVLSLAAPAPCGAMDLLTLGHATVGYGEAILKDVSVTLSERSRVVLLGPNGAGKTTLLRALAGRLPLLEGNRTPAPGLKLGVFTQDLAQDLPAERTALDYVRDEAGVADERARETLGALGLGGDGPLRRIGDLSGGEKARVALACFALRPSSMLLLDEPSNHLDVETLKTLCDALVAWCNRGGTILAVTHSRAFAEALEPTLVGLVRGGRVTWHARGLSDADFDHGGLGAAHADMETKLNEDGGKEGNVDYNKQKAQRRARGRMASIMKKLDEMNQEAAAVDAEMLSAPPTDAELLVSLAKQKDAIDATIGELEEEWIDLANEAEA